MSSCIANALGSSTLLGPGAAAGCCDFSKICIPLLLHTWFHLPWKPGRSFKSGIIRSFNGHNIVEQANVLDTCKKTQFLDGNRTTNGQYVSWFREAWPYIQGHLGSTFVVVIPGEVMANKTALNGILQDISLLHGLGIKLVIVPGTHVQIDVLLRERGQEPKYAGAYRITDAAALEAAMEAAGKIRIELEAKLSQGPLIPVLRRHGQNGRWNEAGVSVAGGNFLAAKRRGVINGVDYGATGEVRKIDVARIRERLDSNCIVLLSNLGWTSTGEVLNCNTYEVATACAISLKADKLLCLLDGPILDESSNLIRFLTVAEADHLIRKWATQSSTATDYVKAVVGPGYVKSLGIDTFLTNKESNSGSRNDVNESNGIPAENTDGQGFAIGGKERQSRIYGCLSELAAGVYVCRSGVRRVHLIDGTTEGVLLLELYTRDGVGTMISSDMYEGIRSAMPTDILGIESLLRPLQESGVVVNRPQEQLVDELDFYTVVERDGSVIACAALFPYFEDRCGEVAAFCVSPECQGHGQGDSMHDYIEKKAARMGLSKLFLLTTRTADWFMHRGFSSCTIETIPLDKRKKINLARGSKYYVKELLQNITT